MASEAQRLSLPMRTNVAACNMKQGKRTRSLTPVAEEVNEAAEPAAKRHQQAQRSGRASSQRQHHHAVSVEHSGVSRPLPSPPTQDNHIVPALGSGDPSQFEGLDFDDSWAVFESNFFNDAIQATSVDTVDELLPSIGSSDMTLREILEPTFFEDDFQQPPSSVLRALERSSRSADEYDPNLQHSSPTTATLSASSRDESVLDHEVDWQGVRDKVKEIPKDKDSNVAQNPPTTNPIQKVPPTPTSSAPQTRSMWVSKSFQEMSLKPCKTFFHIKEMLQAKEETFRNQPGVKFELFARIAHSSRENFHRKQYFQFRDLFKEAPPYISGVLLG